MKKAQLVLMVLLSGFLLSGCPKETVEYYGSLTIHNAPPGHTFFASVYPSNILPRRYSEYKSMTTAGIATGNGASPIRLMWGIEGVKSGSFLLELFSGGKTKLSLVDFKKGEGSVDYERMTDVPIGEGEDEDVLSPFVGYWTRPYGNPSGNDLIYLRIEEDLTWEERTPNGLGGDLILSGQYFVEKNDDRDVAFFSIGDGSSLYGHATVDGNNLYLNYTRESDYPAVTFTKF